MAKVSGLKVHYQSGSDNTLYASWTFGTKVTSTTSKPKVGDTVTIKSGSKWYNGTTIPAWVMAKQWKVSQVSGTRAVINKSTDGANAINSAINVNNLTVVKSTQSPTTLNTLDHYTVRWQYDPGIGKWFDGGSSDVTLLTATYSPPSNAYLVRVSVTPVSKTYTKNNKQVSYWTGVASWYTYCMESMPPDTLSAPSVTLDKYTLKASIENIEDSKTDKVEFQVVNEQGAKFKSGIVDVASARAIFTCTVKAGYKYRVRCRAISDYDYGAGKQYGEWSPYSTEVTTIPTAPTNVSCSVESETSVRVSWTGSSTATGYTVEYTTNKLYFDSSSEVSSTSVTNTYAYITGLETGKEWYFRVKATNAQGDSGWSEIVYKVVGTKPAAPTTWSLTTTAVIGEPVILYWVHNSEDGSKQTQAQIELTVNGEADIITVNTEPDPDEDETIYSYNLDLSQYTEGASILWRVRTRGITFEYSDWSVQRTIDVYAPPVAELTLGDETGILSIFPFTIAVLASPSNQKAITCHISIVAEDAYETNNQIGETVMVNAGDEVYSRVFNMETNSFSYDLMAEEITLENGQGYTVNVTVSMDSGLTAEATGMFTVVWSDDMYDPDASITIDDDTLCAYITPTCFDEDGNFDENVVLAVYRREPNGDFTEIATNIDNNGATSVTDPHPSLDYARYRIVARNKNTNVNSYVDLPGIPVGEPSIVVQWDEEWSQFDYSENAEPDLPPWTGSMIRLPYNVDVSESYDQDDELIEYIGRKYPVSYYGTQKGVGGTWSTDVPKSDKETIYALRRLASWDGDVYVREPSGNGYWANIKVSMNTNHRELVVPVSFTIKRVEGEA